MQLTITAWLHPVIGNATRESKHLDKLIEPRQQHEDDFGYILRIHKLYNINIWLYTPCGGGKVELFKQVDDFNKDRKDVRILVWSNGQIEHCALIKNIETLLVRPNKKITLNIIIAIGVPIGLTHKLNMINGNATTHSSQRLS